MWFIRRIPLSVDQDGRRQKGSRGRVAVLLTARQSIVPEEEKVFRVLRELRERAESADVRDDVDKLEKLLNDPLFKQYSRKVGFVRFLVEVPPVHSWLLPFLLLLFIYHISSCFPFNFL